MNKPGKKCWNAYNWADCPDIAWGEGDRMNIDKMEASPELDRLVAEKVMWWEQINAWWQPKDNSRAEWPVNLWHPSTDIVAAWLVWQSIIDRMWRKMEFMWRFFPESEAGGGVRIMCYIGGGAAFCELGSETASWNVEAETAPLAICRAALKAVGVDKP